MKTFSIFIILAFTSSVPATEIPFDKALEFPATAYSLVAEKRVIWVGEMHGTKEAPELFLGLIKLVSANHIAPPVVALEIPAKDQAVIDRYLVSGDDSLLRASSAFNSEFKDGKSSEAMARLLSALRGEKLAAVVCFDAVLATSAQDRDTKMAEALLQATDRFPSSKLLVLSGSVHSRTVVGTAWDPKYRPAAFELSRSFASLVSFIIGFEGGTAWYRTKDGFGEQKIIGTRWEGTANHYIVIKPEPIRGHNGVIFTRRLTGSPPW